MATHSSCRSEKSNFGGLRCVSLFSRLSGSAPVRVCGRRWFAVALAAALAGLLVLPVAAGAQSGGAFLDGAEPWTESDCAGDVLIVVGSDAAAQSDI